MSSNTADLQEANLVPGAFPSDDAIVEKDLSSQSSRGPSSVTGTSTTGADKVASEATDFPQQQHAAHTAGREIGNTRTSDLSTQDDKAKEFHAQQEAAHTAGGQKTDKYIPASEQQGSLEGAGAHPGQNSQAWTDVSNPEELLRNAEGKASPTASFGTTSGTGQQTSSTPESAGVDLSSIGTGLAETATAFGLAAKDVLFAAKDAAAPAASAATEQVRKRPPGTQARIVANCCS